MWYGLLIGGVSSLTVFSLLVSVPLYVLVLAAIRKNRHVDPFTSEFYSIFVALGCVDICCYLLFLIKKLIFIGYVPEFLTPLNQTNPYCPYLYYPFWVFAFIQYQLTFILTLNRHFSIVMPCFYMQNWTPKCTRILITTSAIVSSIIALPILTANCQISEYIAFRDGQPKTLRYGPYTTTKIIDKYLKTLWAIHVYGLIVSSVVFYGFMIKRLRENRLLLNQKKRQIEMQMFYIGFTVFLLNLVFTVYFLLRDIILIRITTNPHVHEWILYFIADIYDLPNGYILWCTSKRVRRLVYQMLGLEHGGLVKNGEFVFSFLSTKQTARVSTVPEVEVSAQSISSNKF